MKNEPACHHPVFRLAFSPLSKKCRAVGRLPAKAMLPAQVCPILIGRDGAGKAEEADLKKG